MARCKFVGCPPAAWLALSLLTWVQASALAAPPTPAPADKDEPAIMTAKPPTGNPPNRERILAAYEAYANDLRVRYPRFQKGNAADADILLQDARFLRSCGLQLARSPAEEVTLLEQLLDFTQRIEQQQKKRFDRGKITRAELEEALDATMDAEIELVKAKRKAKSPPPKPDR